MALFYCLRSTCAMIDKEFPGGTHEYYRHYGPHGVYYKDEPIKELEGALLAQGFKIIWPQNSADLLKFIEHNPRICGLFLTGTNTASISAER